MDYSLYDLYKELRGKRILFCYSGPFAQSSIEGVGKTLRRNLEIDEAGSNTTLSVFSIFIEQVQNVLNYSAEKINHTDKLENELRVGVVVIGREENGNYFVHCGNRICNVDIPKMSTNLELVRNLNYDELKTLYKERRRMDPQPGSKGAGLGLIEMSRKSVKPIEYSFEKIDDDFSFFSIKVEVGR